jgi:hypothetical protein
MLLRTAVDLESDRCLARLLSPGPELDLCWEWPMLSGCVRIH